MPIHVAIHEGVGVLTLNRPARAHAYDSVHLGLLVQGIRRCAEARVPVLLLHSTGDRAFCAGADLHEMAEADPLDALELLSQCVFNELARYPGVSIAAVQGPAVAGGFELALACDIRVVGPGARFSLPETRLGLIPSAGGCTRLSRLVGPSVAKQVILGGITLDAQRAVALGLALGPEADPLAAARALAGRIATHHDPLACRLAKGILDRGEDPASLEAERVAEALLYSRRGLSRPTD